MVMQCSTQERAQVRGLFFDKPCNLMIAPEACWLVDCHDAFKEDVHYYGIDITQKLFPVLNDDVASRLHLSGGNILKLEDEWSKRVYKLVNQRLLIAGLSAEDWKNAIGNIYKVLSPGGWVQLVETNHCHSGDATERHRAVLKRIFEKRGLLLDPVRNIPDLLHEAGFVGTGTREYEVSMGKWAGEEGVEARENFIGVYRGMKHPVMNEMSMSSPDFDSLIDEMEQEWDSMPGSKIMFNVFYAQKPE